MTTIGFLHTADVHVPVFQALRAELAPGWADVHVVDPALLADAQRDGITGELAARVDARLHELADGGADLIVCTCSTLSEYAETRTGDLGVAVLRVDRPMAEAAVAAGERVAVIATTDSTFGPTGALLRAAAGQAGRRVTLIETPVPGAWSLFQQGDLRAYAEKAAAQARKIAPGADVIVLAQASLAPAAALLADLPIPVLTSPRTAVARAIAEAGPG
ncbi:aspartate/glutamate racemase family protein [Actinoplanes sp. NPDC026619]|uniref:aspartate/glutamate racemase family protein n=1 Tax=Actinoplanes sp. NPDC026619 TaxID=3155798 RepID=UPI003401963B